MVDDLEPGPKPLEPRNPKSKQPAEPARVPQVLRSYAEDKAFSIRRPDEVAALALKSEIIAAVYWLNRWETDPRTGKDYDLRVRPYVTEHYVVGGREYDANSLDQAAIDMSTRHYWTGGTEYYEIDGREYSVKNLAQAAIDRATDHYWKTNFWVHPPLKRGMRQMSKDKLAEAHRRSAEVRGVKDFKGSARHAKPRPGRSVQKRDDDA